MKPAHAFLGGLVVCVLLTLRGVKAQSVPAGSGDLAVYRVVGGLIPASLTGKPGDPANGKAVVLDRKLGNCLSCHGMPIAGAEDPGNVGPDLRGVGARSTEPLMRTRIVDAKLLNPATIMPAYYRVTGLHRVGTDFAGKPILTAQQVEDVVAYLMTLK